MFRTFTFWLLLFTFMRLIFVLVNWRFLEGSLGHKIFLFFAALRLDFSMAAYLSAPVLLLWLVYIFIPKSGIITAARLLTKIFSVPVVIIALINIGNYTYWETVINKRIVIYLSTPAEVAHVMSTWQLILSPLIILLTCWLVIRFYNRYTQQPSTVSKSIVYKLSQFMLLPLCVLFIRGGLQKIPISESDAYYSSWIQNNHAAVNPVFYFVHDLSGYYSVKNTRYNFFPETRSAKLFDEFMQEDGTDTLVLTNIERPNLVIITLESWTADIIEALDGDTGVTPYTGKLIEESYLLTRCYGSGYRTDQGIVSVIAGYPAQPDNSIVVYPSKTESLPSFANAVEKHGYTTSFFCGIDLNFANIKSFIAQQGFGFVSDKNNYSTKEHNCQWGLHDEKILESQVRYLNKQKEPFFSCVLTSSTHEPFDIPIKNKFPNDTEANRFRSAAYYTDLCLKKYFETVKKSPWYARTLFLMVADHGHKLPHGHNLNTPESKRITCFITGGALRNNLRGKRYNQILGQQDLMRWLSPYFKVDPQIFRFSKNPYTARYPSAWYANENVMGLITDSGTVIYEIPNKVSYGDTTAMNFAKAYLQQVYNDFVKR